MANAKTIKMPVTPTPADRIDLLGCTPHELSVLVRLLRSGALPAAIDGEPPLEVYRSAVALHDRAAARLDAWARAAEKRAGKATEPEPASEPAAAVAPVAEAAPGPILDREQPDAPAPAP